MFHHLFNQHQIRKYQIRNLINYFFILRVERPCPTSYNGPCVKAYGFKHHMSLSDNVTEFEVRIF
jgi:hypothetical protein